MNSYEYLQEEAREDGVNVIDYPFDNNPIRGLYCDGLFEPQFLFDGKYYFHVHLLFLLHDRRNRPGVRISVRQFRH